MFMLGIRNHQANVQGMVRVKGCVRVEVRVSVGGLGWMCVRRKLRVTMRRRVVYVSTHRTRFDTVRGEGRVNSGSDGSQEEKVQLEEGPLDAQRRCI